MSNIFRNHKPILTNENTYSSFLDDSLINDIPILFPEHSSKNKDNKTSLNNSKQHSSTINSSSLSYLTDKNNFSFSKSTEISPSNIILGLDKRTTIIIKNIPKQYTPTMLFNELNKTRLIDEKINFFYLPICNPSPKKKVENYGFAILNFIHPLFIINFFHLYHNKTFDKTDKENNSKLSISILSTKHSLNDNNNDNKTKSNYIKNVILPLNYIKLFKKIYPNSVCIVKDINYCNEGSFIVKQIKIH